MTDHASEQAMELEALEAIFAEALEEYDGSVPDGWPRGARTYALTITPAADGTSGFGDDAGGSGDEPALEMQLLFAHTPAYPDEPPALKLRSVRGLADAELAEATAALVAQAGESLGMAMVYDLASAAAEWLAARAASGPGAAGAGGDAEAEEKRRRDEEEAARTAARAHGTPVTIEAFNEWRARFEGDAAAAGGSGGGDGKGGGASTSAAGSRLTGKQWFLQQMAAGKVASGSEEEEELGDDEEDGAEEGDGDDEEVLEDEEEDLDYEDDDDDGMLDEYLAK